MTDNTEQKAVPVAREVTASLWLERAEHCNPILPTRGSPMFAAVAEEMEEYAERKLARFVASLPCKSGEGAGEARQTINDALMDSQYLAGITAGWNAAQDVNPEGALASARKSREGHLAGFKEAKAILSLTPEAAQTREAELVAALHEIDVIAGNTIPPDGKDAAYAALEAIIRLIHPFRIKRAALNARDPA